MGGRLTHFSHLTCKSLKWDWFKRFVVLETCIALYDFSTLYCIKFSNYIWKFKDKVKMLIFNEKEIKNSSNYLFYSMKWISHLVVKAKSANCIPNTTMRFENAGCAKRFINFVWHIWCLYLEIKLDLQISRRTRDFAKIEEVLFAMISMRYKICSAIKAKGSYRTKLELTIIKN